MPKFNLYRKMLTILVVMLIPIIALYVYSNQISSSVLRAELQNSNKDQLKFFQQQMDTTVHSISQWPNLLIYDPDISTLKDMFDMNDEYLDLETIELIKRIQKKLSIQENSVNWASQLSIYSPALDRVITSSKVHRLKEGQLALLSPQGWQMSSFTNANNENQYMFSLLNVSPFSSSRNPKEANLIIEVQFNSNNIVQMLDAYRGEGQRNPFYYINDNEIIYHHTADRAFIANLIQHLSFQELEQSNHNIVDIDGESYLVNMERSSTTGWVLVDYYPLSEMMSPIKKSNLLFYASVVTLLLMAAIVVYILYVQVQVPIKQLVTSFQRLKKEDYSVRLKPKGNTEFSFLFNRFNSMVTQIQELFERSYLEQIHIREAKLKQLQSQINPHFFYNCFSFITSMAKLQNHQAVIAMAQNLSHYYRYTTRQEKEVVTLQEEMTFVQHYLDICAMRMKRLTYEIDVPAWMQQEMIPPLSIQPLVENAILHGIERSSSAGKVSITVTMKNEIVTIKVEDDGKGMSDSEIVALVKSLDYPMREDMGCGLWNVHQRLALRFGEGAGISMKQSSLGGLCVSISWPLKETSKGGTYDDRSITS